MAGTACELLECLDEDDVVETANKMDRDNVPTCRAAAPPRALALIPPPLP